MNKCPHCDTDSVSFWRKQILGPGRSIECQRCKKRVGVHKERAWLCIAPIFIGAFVGKLFFGSDLGWVVGYVVSAPLYHFYVPLVTIEP